jgi:hypothetical protein
MRQPRSRSRAVLYRHYDPDLRKIFEGVPGRIVLGGERPQTQQGDRGRADQKPDQDLAEDCGLPRTRTQRPGGLRREGDDYEEQEEL